jgi:hypothetical protein
VAVAGVRIAREATLVIGVLLGIPGLEKVPVHRRLL